MAPYPYTEITPDKEVPFFAFLIFIAIIGLIFKYLDKKGLYDKVMLYDIFSPFRRKKKKPSRRRR